MRDNLKPHSFQHSIPNILNLQFGKLEEWLHFWKGELANAVKSNGQAICFGFRLVIGGQHEGRLACIVRPRTKFNHHGTGLLNSVEVEARFYSQHHIAPLDFKFR